MSGASSVSASPPQRPRPALSAVDELLLRDVFIRADTDGDGLVSASDIAALVRARRPHSQPDAAARAAERVFDVADADADGALDLADFIAAHAAGPGIVPAAVVAAVARDVRVALRDAELGELQIAFRAHDANDDKLLSAPELRALLLCEAALEGAAARRAAASSAAAAGAAFANTNPSLTASGGSSTNTSFAGGAPPPTAAPLAPPDVGQAVAEGAGMNMSEFIVLAQEGAVVPASARAPLAAKIRACTGAKPFDDVVLPAVARFLKTSNSAALVATVDHALLRDGGVENGAARRLIADAFAREVELVLLADADRAATVPTATVAESLLRGAGATDAAPRADANTADPTAHASAWLAALHLLRMVFDHLARGTDASVPPPLDKQQAQQVYDHGLRSEMMTSSFMGALGNAPSTFLRPSDVDFLIAGARSARRAAASALGAAAAAESARAEPDVSFADFDRDGDGVLSFAEFVASVAAPHAPLVEPDAVLRCQPLLAFLSSADAARLSRLLPTFPAAPREFAAHLKAALPDVHASVVDVLFTVAVDGFRDAAGQESAIRAFQQLVRADATVVMQLSTIIATRVVSVRNILSQRTAPSASAAAALLAAADGAASADGRAGSVTPRDASPAPSPLASPRYGALRELPAPTAGASAAGAPAVSTRSAEEKAAARATRAATDAIDDAFRNLDIHRRDLLEPDVVIPVVTRNLAANNRMDLRVVQRVASTLFRVFDTDDDDKLSRREFRAAVTGPLALFRLGDLLATRDPIARSGLSTPEPRGLPHRDLSYIRHLFARLDADKDGFLGSAALADGGAAAALVLGDTKGRWTAEQRAVAADRFVRAGDLDGDGVLNEHEFVACFARGIARVPDRKAVLDARSRQNAQGGARASASAPAGSLRASSPAPGMGASGSASGSGTFASPESLEYMRYLFSYIDRNRRGVISRDDVAQLLRESLQTHFQNNAERLQAFVSGMMAEITRTDHGDEFSFEQFIDAFRRNPDLMRVSADAVRVRVQRTEDELERLLREEDLRRIARVFVALDADGNGVLDFDEVHDELFALITAQYPDWSTLDVERTVHSIFETADINSDGELSFEEFISTFVNKHYSLAGFIGSSAAQLRRELTAEEVEELKSLFSFMDADNDGRVSADALEGLVRAALRGTERGDDPATVAAIVDGVLAIADTNRDGYLDLREFIAAYECDSQLLDIPIMAAAARREAADQRMQELLCKHDLRDIAKVFLMLDKNGDGYLQAEELADAIGAQLRRLHPEWPAETVDEAVRSVFSAADANSDGRLSLDEFIESFVQGHYLLPPSAVRDVAASFSRKLSDSEVQQLELLFRAIDANGDGAVSRTELERALTEAVGRDAAEAIVNVIMTVADENNDGVLSLQEFLRCYQLDSGLLTVSLSGMSTATLSHVAERLIPKQGLRRLARMFHLLDADADGFLDAAELAAGLARFGFHGEGLLDVARAKILSADLDGDSRLSLDEFIGSFATAGGAGALILPWSIVDDECASPARGASPVGSPARGASPVVGGAATPRRFSVAASPSLDRSASRDGLPPRPPSRPASGSAAGGQQRGAAGSAAVPRSTPPQPGAPYPPLVPVPSLPTVLSHDDTGGLDVQGELTSSSVAADAVAAQPSAIAATLVPQAAAAAAASAMSPLIAAGAADSRAPPAVAARPPADAAPVRANPRAKTLGAGKAASTAAARLQLSSAELAALRADFARFDTDGSGALDAAEFRAAYRRMESFGLPLSDCQLDMAFGPVARDGRVEFDGFCVLMLKRMRL
jgi:Ca2+-binding EF-hand superfamily protein